MSFEAIILPKNEKNASNAEDCSAKKEEELRDFLKKVGSHELNICSAKIMSDIIAKNNSELLFSNIVKSIFDFLTGMDSEFL